ncbi:hypothetical protein QYE76_062669 [Lolium multiflorum]|uniref:CCHC-type domain-containing protein n=1 Tax=Lolium multiflorum TaxID=4521 RepID=A0AAD8S3G8_LOLMU|nr:hypothetical protein QYE76_062669 [Lolium multiflorum]
MTVRTGIGVLNGDGGATAACLSPTVARAGAFCSVPSPGEGMGRSFGRFWALAVSDDEVEGEDPVELVAEAGSGDSSSAEGRRWLVTSVTLEDFIHRAEELGGSLRHRRRRAFAPGGKGSRFSVGVAPRFARLGDAGGRRGGRGSSSAAPSAVRGLVTGDQRRSTRWDAAAASAPPEAVAAGERSVSQPRASCHSGGLDLGRPASAAVLGPEEFPQLPGMSLGSGPCMGSGPFLLSFPTGLEGASIGVKRWLWMPKGVSDPRLGFLARGEEVRRRFSRQSKYIIRPPNPPALLRSFAEVTAMGGDGRNKHRLDGDGGDGRRQEGGGGGGAGYWQEGGSSGGGGGHMQEQGGGRFGANNNNWQGPGYGGSDGGRRQEGGGGGSFHQEGGGFGGGGGGGFFRQESGRGGGPFRQEGGNAYGGGGSYRQEGDSHGHGGGGSYRQEGGSSFRQAAGGGGSYRQEPVGQFRSDGEAGHFQGGSGQSGFRSEGHGSGGGGGYQQQEGWVQPPALLAQQRREAQRRPAGENRARIPNAGRQGPAAGKGGAGKHKGKAGAAGPVGATADAECFKCGRPGHFQTSCTFEPICVICGGEGHASANCMSRGKFLRLQTMGHAIAGDGFFAIEVDPIKGKSTGESFTTVIKFKSTPLSPLQISDELKDLVDEQWDWQVCRLSETEFSVCFPSQATLRMGTRHGKLFLPLNKVEVEIREAFLSPKPALCLPSVWVQLSGVPDDLLEVDRLMAAMVLIGRPLEVDELSLRKCQTEPIRMCFQCRYQERIKGIVQLVVNGEGYDITVKAELEIQLSGKSSEFLQMALFYQNIDGARRAKEVEARGPHTTWRRAGGPARPCGLAPSAGLRPPFGLLIGFDPNARGEVDIARNPPESRHIAKLRRGSQKSPFWLSAEIFTAITANASPSTSNVSPIHV